MWAQTVYICCKGIGSKEKYKELLAGFEPEYSGYFNVFYANGNTLVLTNYENTRIEYDNVVKEFTKNNPKDMLCINDRYMHLSDSKNNSGINQDTFDYYKDGKKIAYSIYKYKELGEENMLELPLDDGDYEYMAAYYKKPIAKFYVDNKPVDEGKFLSIFNSSERKMFDEVLGLLNSKSHEISTLNFYVPIDKENKKQLEVIENKLLKTSGDIVSELNKISSKKNKGKAPVLYNTDGKVAKKISKDERHNILESLELVFGELYPDAELEEDDYYEMMDDFEEDISDEEIEECKLFKRYLLQFFFDMVEVNLDFKHYSDLINVLISYYKSNSKNVLILDHLEMVKWELKESPKDIIKNHNLGNIVKKFPFNKLIKMLRNVEKSYSYYKPHFVASIDKKHLKDLDTELIAFSANGDTNDSPFDDVYVCVKNTDVSKVKKYAVKSVGEVEYKGSNDKYISIYTMEYKKSELNEYIYE